MSTAAPPVGTTARGGLGPGRILLIVVGSVGALIALALLAAGGVLVWANATQRDADGFFTTPTERFETPTYALTHEEIDVLAGDDAPAWVKDRLGTVKVVAESSAPVFVGIAPADDVAGYLGAVERDVVDDVRYDPFRVDYLRRGDGAPETRPGRQEFWVASREGSGAQTLTWKVEQGDWALVVMNADASRGVAADVELGGQVGFLGWVALGLFVAGGLLAAGSAVLLALGIRGSVSPGPSGAAALPTPATVGGGSASVSTYPVSVEAALDPGLSRWLWLVKWFLAIPHWIALVFLWAAYIVLTVVAFFAILFTGRYPRSIFEFNVGVVRWTWRVAYYATNGIGTDRYPPFTLADVPEYPARVAVAYPERLSRGLVLVKWLLAIPHLVIVALFVGGVGWAFEDARLGPFSLNTVLVLVAGISLLFTARYPQEVWRLVVGINRWALRVIAYVSLMRDEYPPFRLEP